MRANITSKPFQSNRQKDGGKKIRIQMCYNGIPLLLITTLVLLLVSGCRAPGKARERRCTAQNCTCAARSLYRLCRHCEIEISYEKCRQLLPVGRQGNSMLEVKTALQSLGFHVRPQRITITEFADIRQPAVVLLSAPQNPQLRLPGKNLGHYLVVCPEPEHHIRILDNPRNPVTVSTDYWIQHLRRLHIHKIPILLCRPPTPLTFDTFLHLHKQHQIF